MTRVRLMAAAGAVVASFLLIPAAPASAAANVTVNIASPASGFVASSPGVQVSGNATIDNSGLGTNDITGVTIQVTGPVSRSCTGCGFTYAQGQPSTSFSYQADLPYNGPYSATVTVTGTEYLALNLGGTPRSGAATRSFKVGVAPAQPTGVRAVVNGDRTTTVTWRANTEPDIVGYQVQRTDKGSRSALIAKGSPLAWTDTQTTQNGGQYSYVVYVARTGSDGPSGNPISAGSSAVGVDVPAPPPPSTTADGGTVPPLIQPTPTSVGTGGPNLAAPTLDLSGFLSRNAGSTAKPAGPGLPKLVTPGEQAAPDTGFQPTLPFPLTAGQGGRAVTPVPGALAAQSAGSRSSTKRTILLPFAAGLFLCVVGIHVRWFNRRFGGDGTDPSLLPVEDVPAGGIDVAPARAPTPPPPTSNPAPPAPLDDEAVLVTW